MYDYDPSRSQAVPVRLLEGSAGHLQTDGYGKVFASPAVTRLECVAHARRMFNEALLPHLMD